MKNSSFKLLDLVLIFVLNQFFVTAYAQNTDLSSGLSGHILSSDSIPLGGASITVLQLPDSIVRGVTLSDPDGYFSLEISGFPTDIVVSRKGYFDKSLRLTAPANNLEIYLDPESKELAEFTVKATRASIKAKPGMFVYDPGDMARYMSNARELMEYVPLVGSFERGNIALFSKVPGAKIFINGEDPLMHNDVILDKLRQTPSSKIKRIELILNPGVKYGEEYTATGIINIIMDDDFKGWNATVNAGTDYMNGRFHSVSGDASWFYQNHNFLFSVYPFYRMLDNREMKHNMISGETENLKRIVDQEEILKTHSPGLYLTGDYRFGKNSIGASLGVYTFKSSLNAYYNESESEDDEIRGTIISHSSTVMPWDCTIDATARYLRWLDDTKKSSLNVKAKYFSRRPCDVKSTMNQFSENSENVVATNTYTRNQSYDTHFDFVRLDVTFNKTFADRSSLSVNGNTYIYDFTNRYTDPDDAYDFNLNNKGAVIKIDYERQWWDFLSMRLGLMQSVLLRNINEKLSSRHYKNTFWPTRPTVDLTFSFMGGNHSINLNYTREWIEPGEDQLNPYRRWLSATEYSEGNPHLKMTYYNNFSLSYSLFSQAFMVVRYSTGNIGSSPFKYLDSDGNTVNTFLPTTKSNDLSVDLSWTKFFFRYRWRLVADGSMIWTNSSADTGIGRMDIHSIAFLASLSNQVKILPRYGFSGSIGYYFNGPFRSLASRRSASHRLRLSLKKTLWQNAEISGNLSVPLNSSKLSFYAPGMEQISINRYATDPYFSVNFTWSLGKFSIERVFL